MPEKLHLLYPKSLAGRFEMSNDLRANVEVADPRSMVVPQRLVDLDEIRALIKIVLRLESICSNIHACQAATATSPRAPQHPGSTGVPHAPGMELAPSRRPYRSGVRLPPAMHLGPTVHENMGDDELLLVVESLTTRLENSMSSLASAHLPDVGRVADNNSTVYETPRWVYLGVDGLGASDADRPEIARPRHVPYEGRHGSVAASVSSCCGGLGRAQVGGEGGSEDM